MSVEAAGEGRERVWTVYAPTLATGILFLSLFAGAMSSLARDWWSDPDAGHGLLLAPVALVVAWRGGLIPERRPAQAWGWAIMVAGVSLRFLSGLAAEPFTLRMAMWMTLSGLIVAAWGFRQLRHWWLPAVLLALSVPLPDTILSSLALPLQLRASAIGASLLAWREVPVLLAGNVIHLPGRSLFVTEACSGLRSLTALMALAVLTGAGSLPTPWLRLMLVAVSIPIAVMTNGVRVFVTGFLVYFVDPRLGESVMHFTEGWVLFVVSFVALLLVSRVLSAAHELYLRLRAATWRQAPITLAAEEYGG